MSGTVLRPRPAPQRLQRPAGPSSSCADRGPADTSVLGRGRPGVREDVERWGTAERVSASPMHIPEVDGGQERKRSPVSQGPSRCRRCCARTTYVSTWRGGWWARYHSPAGLPPMWGSASCLVRAGCVGQSPKAARSPAEQEHGLEAGEISRARRRVASCCSCGWVLRSSAGRGKQLT